MPDTLQTSNDMGVTWVDHTTVGNIIRFKVPFKGKTYFIRFSAEDVDPPIEHGEIRLVRVVTDEGEFIPETPLRAMAQRFEQNQTTVLDGRKLDQL